MSSASKEEHPVIPESFFSLPIRFPFGLKLIEQNGKKFLEPATESDFRQAESERLGIKPEDVIVNDFPEKCAMWHDPISGRKYCMGPCPIQSKCFTAEATPGFYYCYCKPGPGGPGPTPDPPPHPGPQPLLRRED
jgi:hypothetical protein